MDGFQLPEATNPSCNSRCYYGRFLILSKRQEPAQHRRTRGNEPSRRLPLCRTGRAGGSLRGRGSRPGRSRLSGEDLGTARPVSALRVLPRPVPALGGRSRHGPSGPGSRGKISARPVRSRLSGEAPPGPGAASGAAAAVPGGGAGAMGVTRQKHAKKIMGFYKHNFQFREPFQVLLDGTFCQAALRNKIQIREQLPGYLGGAAQLCTTRCVIKELESLGKALYGAKLIAQRFQVRSCSHHKNPVSGSTCLLSMIEDGNPHHFFIATQDQELSNKVKRKPGIPLLFIIQNTMVLDKPSPKSLAFVQKSQTNQLVPEYQKQSIVELKEKEGLVKQEGEKRRKRKRAGGPNPLSCLKKKKKKTQEGQEPSAAKKKRRKRIRNRVKAEVMQSVQKNEGE